MLRMKNVSLDMFFDRRKVTGPVDKATRGVLSKAGAFVRTAARHSIRTRKGTSPPGSPPYSHTGVLKRFLFFGYDPARRTVVVGPMATNQVFFGKDRRPVRGTVPEVLEYGGKITILEVERGGTWLRADLRSRRRLAGRPMRYRTANIAARPYMGPAMKQELPKFPSLWANSVK
jgi:hypothetical protein